MKESLKWKNYLIKIGIFEIILLLLIICIQKGMNGVNGGIDYIGEALAYAFLYRGIIALGTLIIFISLLIKIIRYKKSTQEKGKWFVDIFICILMSFSFRLINEKLGSIIYDYFISKDYIFSLGDYFQAYSRITLIYLVSFIIGILLIYNRFYKVKNGD